MTPATAERLLHEAQYAFQSITFGESSRNKRNAARARRLCRKLMRKMPGTMYASEAHAILLRLGDEAYTSNLARQHRHITQAEHHNPSSPVRPAVQTFIDNTENEVLDWAGLLGWFFSLPKAVLTVILVAGLFLFGLLGPLLFLPLIAVLFLTSPFQIMLNRRQREKVNDLIVRINVFIAERRNA